jgi:hypothetical protein
MLNKPKLDVDICIYIYYINYIDEKRLTKFGVKNES